MKLSSLAGELRDGWDRQALAQRLRAASIHFTVCVLVASLCYGVLVWALHPAPYFGVTGAAGILAVIVAVDVVAGPLLTFLVFDRRKPELRRDLFFIGVVQALALAYGVHAAVLARPVFLTFVVDRFELVSAAEIDAAELERAPRELMPLSWSGPVLAAARRPTDPAEREALIFASMAGVDLRHMLRYYTPYDTAVGDVLARAKPLDALRPLNTAEQVRSAIEALELGPAPASGLRWLPVQGRRGDLVAFVDDRTARVVGVADLRPW